MRKKLTEYPDLTKDEAEALGIKTDIDCAYICKGGQLVYCRWNYDELTDNGKYIFLDVSDSIQEFLFERIRFADDLRLKDILMLVKNNIDFIEPIIGEGCRDAVTYGLQNIKPYVNEYSPDEIEFLEFYRYLNVEQEYFHSYTASTEKRDPKKFLEGMDELGLHGMGYVLEEIHNHWPKGQRIPWAISYVRANEVADTPIVINDEIIFYDHDKEKEKYTVYSPRLINVIRELFFELRR